MDYQVPTFDALMLSVQGEDLVAVAGSGDELTELSAHLGSTFVYQRQNPNASLAVGNQADLRADPQEDGSTLVQSSEVLQGEARQYFNGPRGLYLGAGAGLGVAAVGEADPTLESLVFAGAGYGRIVDARTVAQAAAVYEALDRPATAEDLLRVAEIIGQRNAYGVTYRFEANQVFYADLTEALGGLEGAEAFIVQQVLESPIYNIGARQVGWEVGVRGASVVTGLGSSDALGSSYVQQHAGYAHLLDARTGLLVEERVTLGLDDRAESTLDDDFVSPGENVVEGELQLTVNRNHSAMWESLARASLTQTLDLEANQGAPTYELGAQTNVALGVRGVASAGVAVQDTAGDDLDTEWRALASFRIFLL